MPTSSPRCRPVHFAAFNRRIGFYPVPRGNTGFRDEHEGYEGGTGR